MNAKSPLPMPAINDWLSTAKSRLADAKIPSYNLDAELILAYSIDKNRTYLHAHPEQIISANKLETANKHLTSRLSHIPIAYIIGQKEFYGRDFIVDSSVLIPRPESESIIEILQQINPISHFPTPNPHLIDIGTGSGCLGITAKLEFPNLNVTLADISSDALEIAKTNATRLSADVKIIKSNLLKDYNEKVDIIIANLPYVDKAWERSPETNHEPALALFANDGGKSLIYELIAQTDGKISKKGYLIIEADPIQHDSITEFAQEHAFELVKTSGYAVAFKHQHQRY